MQLKIDYKEVIGDTVYLFCIQNKFLWLFTEDRLFKCIGWDKDMKQNNKWSEVPDDEPVTDKLVLLDLEHWAHTIEETYVIR